MRREGFNGVFTDVQFATAANAPGTRLIMRELLEKVAAAGRAARVALLRIRAVRAFQLTLFRACGDDVVMHAV